MKTVQVGNLTLGGGKGLFLLAGPCVIEGYDRTLAIGRRAKEICEKVGIPYVFKASFDKANRSSYSSFRGPGLVEGLEILKAIKEELQVPVVSDIHDITQIEPAAEVLDPSNSSLLVPSNRFSIRSSCYREMRERKKRSIHGS